MNIGMKKATIRTQNLSKHFIQAGQKIIVLDGIDSLFTQEKSYAIAGISGSGKSTFMHIIAGLEKPTKGTVLFNDSNIQEFSADELARFLNSTIGLLFQSPYLLKELFVIENIMLPGMIKGDKTNSECAERAEYLLNCVGIASKKDARIGELSGGEQQRAALARALFNEPQFLIADEPTSNLDIQTGKTIIDLLMTFHHEWGMGLIVSSHDEYVTERMDQVYTLKDGKFN